MWRSGCLLVFHCGNESEIEKSAQYEENEKEPTKDISLGNVPVLVGNRFVLKY